MLEILKDHPKWKKDKLPTDLINPKQCQSSKKSRTSENTSQGNSDSAHIGVNLNDEAADSKDVEAQEVPAPIGRDHAKKKGSSSSARSETSIAGDPSLVDALFSKIHWNKNGCNPFFKPQRKEFHPLTRNSQRGWERCERKFTLFVILMQTLFAHDMLLYKEIRIKEDVEVPMLIQQFYRISVTEERSRPKGFMQVSDDSEPWSTVALGIIKKMVLLMYTNSAFIGQYFLRLELPALAKGLIILIKTEYWFHSSQTFWRFDSIMECVLHSFVAENEPDQDMIYEDFDQVDQLEMEELDLKWQMAMLSLRINRFEKKAGQKMNL
ncbi:hypothetical protein Tco_0210544 [Tanacetum coccineum]